MQFDWVTFTLEIINFLILVWILKRFLYRPVLEMIARRRLQVEHTLNEAKDAEARALELKASYEKRMEEWEQERDTVRAKLREEIAAERQRRMVQLEEMMAAEGEKARALEARRAEEVQRTAEMQALELGAAFSSRLLGRLAGAELDARLIDLLIEDLAALPAEQRASLQAAASAPGTVLQIEFARAVPIADQQRLTAALHQALGTSLPDTVQIAPELLAGARIGVGPWVMQANLGDELSFFRSGMQGG